MQCYVYKSVRRAETYVYLARPEDFDALPDPIRANLEPLSFVLEFVLDEGRKLAREDAGKVRENLRTRGWHLQMPPSLVVPPATDDGE